MVEECGILEWPGAPFPARACPYVRKLSSDPGTAPLLSQCGWEVTGALREREGVRTRCWERALTPAGVEEDVGKGGETAHFRQRWHVNSCCIRMPAYFMEHLARNNTASLKYRKITSCGNFTPLDYHHLLQSDSVFCI